MSLKGVRRAGLLELSSPLKWNNRCCTAWSSAILSIEIVLDWKGYSVVGVTVRSCIKY